VHSLQETVLPQTNGTGGKPRDSEGVPFASLESMTRHLADIGPGRVPKSGHVTITKIENLHETHIEKNHRFQKCHSFRSTTKLSRKKPFQNSGLNRCWWCFRHITVLERSIEVGFSLILLIYKVVYISIKDLHAGCAATRSN